MAAIEIRNIDHVVLRVADLGRALRFYCEVLGCREERRLERLGLVQLRAGASMIDLIDMAVAREGNPAIASGANMDHLALRLESFEEAALRRHLERHGVAPGEVATRYGADGEGPSMYIRDPDGNVVELKGPPAPAASPG
ncbi:MAG: VOC family protein [Pseudomonadota bacterium]